MKSKWKVAYNPMGGKTPYGVYRIIDMNKINHSGNRELFGNYLESKHQAQVIADKLNKEEEVI